MGKRGKSMQEKKDAMVAILQKEQAPFTLKELEKLGGKAGVNSMSIKGVLEELRDDNIIESDKIGSSIYFWCFPSKKLSDSLKHLSDLDEEKQNLEKQVEAAKAKISALKAERLETEERKRQLSEWEALKSENKQLKEQMGEISKKLEKQKLLKLLEICKESAHRWTDNTWAFASYLKKRHGCSNRDAQLALHMTEDFDYPEYIPKKKKQKSEKE